MILIYKFIIDIIKLTYVLYVYINYGILELILAILSNVKEQWYAWKKDILTNRIFDKTTIVIIFKIYLSKFHFIKS